MSQFNCKRIKLELNSIKERNLFDKRHEDAVEVTPPFEVHSKKLTATEMRKVLQSKENNPTYWRLRKSRNTSSLFRGLSTCVHLNPEAQEADLLDKILDNVDDEMPPCSFKLDGWTLHPNSLSCKNLRESMYRFWRTCGPYMKNLTLKDCFFEERQLMSIICSLTPNLESLKIEGFVDFPEIHKKSQQLLQPNENLKILHIFSQTWSPAWSFLEWFPNLEELRLTEDVCLFQSIDSNVVPALRLLRQVSQGSILKLKSLEAYATESCLDDLVEAALPLKHLTLIMDGEMDEKMFPRTMFSMAGTLKSLKLVRFPLPYSPPQSSSMLNFEFLEEVHLCGHVICDINFVKKTPSLKKLVLEWTMGGQFNRQYFPQFANASSELVEDEAFQHRNLKHFETDVELDVQTFQYLGKWFPNLKTLAAILDEETLPVVRQQWPKLEKPKKLSCGSNVTCGH